MTTALSLRDRIAAKRGDIAAGKSKGLRPYKFKVGDTLFRILPDKDPNADWDRRFGQLYLKSFDGADLVVIGDKFLTYGQEDPLREMVFDGMKRAPSEDVKDHFKEMLGGPRVIFNALILNDKEQPAGEPVLVELSETQFDMILAQFMIYLDVDPSHDLASLTRGHVFQCSRTGTGKNDTKYTFLATPKPAPLGAAILDKAHDLDGWVTALFEAKEQKALGVLGKLGINTAGAGSVAAVLTGCAGSANAALTAPPVTNISTAAVTSVLDDSLPTDAGGPAAGAPVIEDAVYTPVVDTPVDPIEAALAAINGTAALVVETVAPVQAPVQQVAAPTPAPTPPKADVPPANSADIDAILASLD